MIYTGSDGVTKFSTIKTSKYKYKKANQFGHAWSAVAPPSSVGFVSEAMDAKSLAGMKPYEDIKSKYKNFSFNNGFFYSGS